MSPVSLLPDEAPPFSVPIPVHAVSDNDQPFLAQHTEKYTLLRAANEDRTPASVYCYPPAIRAIQRSVGWALFSMSILVPAAVGVAASMEYAEANGAVIGASFPPYTPERAKRIPELKKARDSVIIPAILKAFPVSIVSGISGTSLLIAASKRRLLNEERMLNILFPEEKSEQ